MIKTEIVDTALIDAIAEVLQVRVLDLAIERAVQRLSAGRETHTHRRAEIGRELSVIESRLRRLADAVANSDDGSAETLVA